jgi:putative flippase GtrA
MPTRPHREAPTVNGGWRVVARHQLGALGATLVDFATMIGAVHAGASAVAGTALGASVGALVNFALARQWIFPAGATAPIDRQAVRYALVSLSSLALNTLGEHLFHDVAHVQYVVARVIVAGGIGLGWNYPLHRNWVFGERGARSAD